MQTDFSKILELVLWSKTKEIRVFLTTYYKESPEGQYRAEIHEGSHMFFVEYYSPSGQKLKTETFENKSIHYVTDAVENWAAGIKILNG